MDAKRAQEISASPDMVNVTCNGKPVYIEHVDQEAGTATIHNLNDPNNKESVSVSSLSEE
jgi:small acid-soluble spore protein H (minor)